MVYRLNHKTFHLDFGILLKYSKFHRIFIPKILSKAK